MAGDSADLTLTGVDAAALHSGCVLCHPDFPVRLAVKFTAQVLVLDVGLPLLKGHAVTIHTHSAREAGVISHLVALCDGKTGAVTKQRPRCLLGGQVSCVGCGPYNKGI
jgi:elongation factor 1 alpha-like protein